MDALGQRLKAGGFHRWQPVAQHRGEDLDHLPVAVVEAGKLAPHAVQGRRQHPVLERRAVTQGARLARQNWHVVPGIVNRIAPAKAATMLVNGAAIFLKSGGAKFPSLAGCGDQPLSVIGGSVLGRPAATLQGRRDGIGGGIGLEAAGLGQEIGMLA